MLLTIKIIKTEKKFFSEAKTDYGPDGYRDVTKKIVIAK